MSPAPSPGRRARGRRLGDRPHHGQHSDEAAPACRRSASGSTARRSRVPLVGDFHYNGHRLLADLPDCARPWPSSASIPAMSASATSATAQFELMIEAALRYDRPVRIGVNWGSLDQDLATRLMDENARSAGAGAADEVMREALVRSALDSAARAEAIGLPADRIVISAKVCRVQDLIAVYRELARRSAYALHLGPDRGRMGIKGIVAIAAALALLLQEGIGDTIRASLTPRAGRARAPTRSRSARNVLQSLGLRSFAPQVTACPGCGRTTSTYFQELADASRAGCAADAGLAASATRGRDAERRGHGLHRQRPGRVASTPISASACPAPARAPAAPVFIDGQKVQRLRGEQIAEEFQATRRGTMSRRASAPSTPERNGPTTMSQLRPVRGTHDLLGDEARRHRACGGDGPGARGPLRLWRDRHADLRVHRGVRPYARRDVGRRDQGDVHLRGPRRRAHHAAAGEHRRRRPGVDQRRARPAVCR